MTDFDKVIPPGSEGKIHAKVDISHAKGAIQKQVQLETNQTDQPQTLLYIKAVIKTYVDVQPDQQVTFNVSKGQPGTQQLTLTPAAGKSIKLHDATVDSNSVEVKLEPHDNEYVLNVSLKPDVPVGNQRATIKIQEEDSPEKELTIPVFAMVRGPISVAPPAVAFDIRNYPDQVAPRGTANIRQQPGDEAAVIEKANADAVLRVVAQNTAWYQVITPGNRAGWISKAVVKTKKLAAKPEPVTVSLQKSNGQEFKLLEYSSSLAQIKVEKVTQDGKIYTLKVTLLQYDRTQKGNVTGAIIVKTDEPDQASIRIPVYINIS